MANHSMSKICNTCYDDTYKAIKTGGATKTVLTWTGAISTGNNEVPDTDTAVLIAGAKNIYIQFDTIAATTGAPNFNLDVIASSDGTVYETVEYATPFTAQAKGGADGAAVTVGPEYLKLRLDVNNAGLAATESVKATILVNY